MFKEFRDFIMRGNVVDLAVAVVIGAAFTAVVTALVEGIVMPLVTMIVGKPSFDDLTFSINSSKFLYGSVLTALVTFLAIAAVVFFLVVKPMNLIAERRKKGVEPEPEKPSEDILLLTEIRDLLAQGQPPASETPSRPT
jgi:large conductance mechanosensitive channel